MSARPSAAAERRHGARSRAWSRPRGMRRRSALLRPPGPAASSAVSDAADGEAFLCGMEMHLQQGSPG